MSLFSLCFTAHGTAQLFDDEDNMLWTSDNDMDFRDEIADEFLGEDDADEVIQYLYEQDFVSDDDDIEVYEDALDQYEHDASGYSNE